MQTGSGLCWRVGKVTAFEARAKNNGSIDSLDNPALVLYDTSGNELARALNGGANQLDASLFYAVPGSAPTTFYIGVYSERGRGAYEVVVTDLKNDVGHTASTAVEKTLVEGDNDLWGREWRGSIDYPNDRDWYKVTLRPNQSYRMHLKGSVTNDGTLNNPGLQLFDADSNRISSDGNSGTGLNALVTHSTGNTAETVYIEARDDLRIRMGTYLVIVHETGDLPSENSYEHAEELSFKKGVAGKRDRIHYKTDIDWFKVSLKPGRTYRFYFWASTLNENDPSISLNWGHMAIFDQDGMTALSSPVDLRSILFRSRLLNSAARFYRTIPGDPGDPEVIHYIRIKAQTNSHIGRYTLRINQVPGTDDYGSSTSNAGVLKLRGVPAKGSINGDVEVNNDKDWFRVDLRNGAEYTIQLFGDPLFPGALLGYPILVLRDSTGVEIKRVIIGAGAREIVFRVPGIFGETTYYLEVGGRN